jgi:hypothetical protein
MQPFPSSTVIHEGSTYTLVRLDTGEKALLLDGDARGFEIHGKAPGGASICLLSAENAAALRERLPWLAPAPLGLRTSVGLGDRLGLATPGHARAVKGSGIAPVFAQQSVRENARTGRTPRQVIDDAMWGVFQAGWKDAWGADADHLKRAEDLPAFLEAGYTFFTIDPGEHVQEIALDESADALSTRLDPAVLSELRTAYRGRSYSLDSLSLTFDEVGLLRAAVKYGRAVDHAAHLYRQIERAFESRPFDFELSVDETDSPTTPLEHIFIASELTRQGVRWTSLAPRFVGAFEKGVDFIGDLIELEAQIDLHAAVSRIFGGYKLSLHSGSDKFSVYPAAAKHTRGRMHLKTAGTSYLEALRVIARHAPALFRQVFTLSLARYETDRASYHVSARPERIPTLDTLFDVALPGLLDHFDARQVLHVAFGTVLAEHGAELHGVLERHEEAYADGLTEHLGRHVRAME